MSSPVRLYCMLLVQCAASQVDMKDIMKLSANSRPIPHRVRHTCIAVSLHKERRMCLITHTHTAGCWSV